MAVFGSAAALWVWVFFLGITVGSFLNVVIMRGGRGEGTGGRSRCDACGRVLGVRELIPIVSFIFQKGRCRFCGAVLSWQYPLVECATGIAFVLAWWWLVVPVSVGLPPLAAGILALAAFAGVSAGVVIIVADLRYQIIPNGAVVVVLLIGVLVSGWGRGIGIGHPPPGADVPAFGASAVLADGAAAILLAGLLALLWLFSRGQWMGLGDAKLVLATSLVTGFPRSLVAFLLSFWLGGIVGAVLLLWGDRGLKSRIPFGPFIIAGVALAYFFSDAFLAFFGLALVF